MHIFVHLMFAFALVSIFYKHCWFVFGWVKIIRR